MPGNHGEHRSLLVHIYYPANKNFRGNEADYFPHLKEQEAYEDQHFGQGFFKDAWGPAYEALRSTHTHAIEGAPIMPGRAQYPVVVFSHGGGIPVLFYSAILEDLASHGYVVAAVEHPYDGDIIIFPDGHVVEQSGWDEDSKRSLQEQAAFHRSRLEVGGQDDSFVLDQLTKLNSGSLDPRFRRRLDLRRVAAMGHSFGGKLSIYACGRDKRFKACINLDGGLDPGERYPAVSQPILAMFGGPPPRRNEETDEGFAKRQAKFFRYMKPLVAQYDDASPATASIALLALPGYSHYSAYDMQTGQVTVPWSTSEEQWTLNKQVINALIIAFLEQHLFANRNALRRYAAANPQVTLWPLPALRSKL